MICPNCGANNINGSSFCIKCGANLREQQRPINNISNQNINEQNIQQQQNMQQPVQQVRTEQTVQQVQQPKVEPMNNVSERTYNNEFSYLSFVISMLLKPIKSFNNNKSNLDDSKTTLIFTLIVSGIMTLFNLIKTMFLTVRVSSESFFSDTSYSWEWDNLKDLNYIQLIGKNFLIYICIILAISIVFYIASLIIKKQISFIRTLAISTVSVIPAAIGLLILSPIGTLIWDKLGIVFTCFGLVYSFIILYELINNELKLEGDIKVIFNSVCFGILVFAGYFAFLKLFMSASAFGLDDLFDLFG